jgi:hypothetical protein
MKLLILFLLTINIAIAQEAVDKVKYADHALTKLDIQYKAINSICVEKGFHTDLQTECTNILKIAIKDEFKSLLQQRLSKIRDESYALALADKREAECVKKLQAQIDVNPGWGLSYNGDETCAELKFAIANK